MKRRGLVKAQVVLLAGISAAALVGGCAAPAGGALYVQGELEGAVKAPLGEVYAASVDALSEMNITVTEKEKTEMNARIVGRTAMDKKVRITLAQAELNRTRVNIRVGTFGDEPMSREIHDKIRQKL